MCYTEAMRKRIQENRTIRNHKRTRAGRRIRCAAFWMTGVLFLTDCAWQGEETPSIDTENVGGEDALYAPQTQRYDSEDTAIVIRYDTEEKTISLRNLETGRQYTLSYGGTTELFDKNGQALTMGQLKPGELVDVRFVHYNKTLVSLRASASAFLYEEQTDYEISESGRSMTVNGVRYKLADDLAVLSGGELIGLMDINSVDALTLRGFDFEIHSICVDRGHGYLRLSNDESFIGGWIEVGSGMIVPITENMLLTVPEGSYDVSVSGEAGHGTMPVTIYKNQEQTLDIGDFVVVAKEGEVFFDVTPANASVYVDGEKIDPSEAVTLTYGLHLLTIRADGCETMVKYLSVGQEYASLKMELERADGEDADDGEEDSGGGEDADGEKDPDGGEDADEENSPGGGEDADGEKDPDGGEDADEENSPDGGADGEDEEGSGASPTGGAADGDSSAPAGPAYEQTPGSGESDVVTASDGSVFYVSVTAPTGVEVYVDGVYVGISPVRFKKVSGSHVVSLRSNGYQTRSYTIELDDEKKDVTYSFSELIKTSQ